MVDKSNRSDSKSNKDKSISKALNFNKPSSNIVKKKPIKIFFPLLRKKKKLFVW